jgi:hypothetical protein
VEDLDALLRRQVGLVTRPQLRNHGVSRAALRWRLGRGWRLVLPGVVATFTGRLDARQRLVAAQLFAGPEAMIAASTAATWHGVTAATGPLVRLLVPGYRAARRADFVRVDRTSRPDPRPWRREPLFICSRPRAVVDAARGAPTAQTAAAIVIEAVQRRIVRAADLRHELEAGPVRGSAQVRVAVQRAEAGAWSVPEGDLLGGLATSSLLPPAWPNPVLTARDGTVLPSPDAWFDDVGLAVQVHSRKYHGDEEDWDATVMGDGVLGEYGIHVTGATPSRIERDLPGVVARIERTYASLQGRPRPPVVARRRGHGQVA